MLVESDIQIALAQFSVVRAAPDANLEYITRMAVQSKNSGASLLILPEMATTGFDWIANREHLPIAALDVKKIAEIASSYLIDIAGSFLEYTEEGRAANTFYYFDSKGECIFQYRKMHLFTLFQEERYVQAGDSVSIGDTCIGKTGAGICYDLRFPELFRAGVDLGAEVFILPAAFPHPRLVHWQTLVRARAIENQCYMIAVNQVGSELHADASKSVTYFGHSMVVDPWGEIVFEAGDAEGLYFVTIDLSRVAATRGTIAALRDRRIGVFS